MIIPIIVLIVIVYGLIKKINVYDVFIEGTKESFNLITSIFPSILGMMFAINIFLKSNILKTDIVSMAIMRSISGSSSLAILSNILKQYGPDSFIGLLGSTIQGSTETTFYVITLYFGFIGIKKIKYALWIGLLADLIAVLSSIFIINLVLN